MKTKELNDGWLVNTEEWISERALDESSAKVLPTNTVLMAMYGVTVGKLGILASPMACNQASCAMIVDPFKADFRYLYYRLLHDRPRLAGLANGAAQQNLSAAIIKKFSFPCPTLEEQRRIAAALGAIDDLIDTNELVASQATSLAQSLAKRAGDQLISLSVIAEFADSRTVVPEGSVDHYSLPAFDNGVMPERVDGSEIRSNKTLVDSPVVLVSRLNPRIPRVWVVYPDQDVMSVASTEFVPMRGINVAVEEVFALVSSDLYLSQLSSRVTGTTGSHQRVDKKGLFELQVPDVRRLPVSEREAIIDFVREAHASRRASAELRRTRDELLPLLMSGAVRVRPEGVAA